MRWLAAIMMATEIASAAVGVAACAQTAPALTPQQKQELSTYNFKGAEAALEAQDIQPASKPSALTPIPPLKVPPITSRSLPAQSSPAGAPADKGSEAVSYTHLDVYKRQGPPQMKGKFAQETQVPILQAK